MKKNKRGFTLIELLATIVIIGILAVLGLPMILNLISSNHKKIYISDAQRLITKAEYKIKTNSSEIERPDPGSCIIITLNYLDDESFDNPPFEGSYEKDVSFVIVKNTNSGDLEYSVMLVEYTKDHVYQGVELTRDFALEQRDAIKHVKVFQESDLDAIRITDNYNTSNLDKSEINQMLKNSSNVGDSYVSGIDGIYVYPKMADTVVEENNLAPKIDKIVVESASGKPYNSLDASLSLSVNDQDTPRSALKVYISTESYVDAKKHKYSFTDSESVTFNKKFDFSKAEASHKDSYDYKDGGKVTFYVIVVDDRGFEDKKTKEYEIHKNSAPSILEDSSIYRRSSDSYNGVNAVFKLSLDDDLDNVSDLAVCFTEDRNASTCSNYKSYKELFDDNHEMAYLFQGCSPTGCSLNGANVTLKVFVKDSYGQETTSVLPDYILHSNGAPVLQPIDSSVDPSRYQYISVTSNSNNYPLTGSLDVMVRFTPTDDISESNNINVILNEIDASGNVLHSSEAMKYAGHEDGFPFKFSGGYDGKNRYLQVVLKDEHGFETSRDSSMFKTSYQVYQNKAPVLKSFVVNSSDIPCTDVDFCAEEDGGSTVVNVEDLVVEDDLDDNSKLKICVSTTKSDCTNPNSSSFQPYSSFANSSKPFQFSLSNSSNLYPYTGDMKTIYVSAMDANRSISNVLTKDYKLYQNKPPELDGNVEIVDEEKVVHVSRTYIGNDGEEKTEEEDVNLTLPIGKFKYRFAVRDDLSKNSEMEVQVCYRLKGSTQPAVCKPKRLYGVDRDETSSQEIYYYEENIDLGLSRYTGATYEIYATVKDSYYQKTSSILEIPAVEYQTYEDVAPQIQSAYGVVASSGYSEDTMKVGFTVFDPYDTYQICVHDVNDASKCTKYVGLDSTTSFNGTNLMDYSIDYKAASNTWNLPSVQSANSQEFFLFVKDSYGHVSEGFSFEYSGYETCKETLNDVTRDEYSIEENKAVTYQGTTIPNNKAISPIRCGGKCYYWDSLTEDLAQQMERVDANGRLDLSASDTSGIFGYYQKRLTYRDKNIPSVFCKKTPDSYDIVRFGCDYVDCFYHPKYKEVTGSDGETTTVLDSSRDAYQNYAIGLVVYETGNWIETKYQTSVTEGGSTVIKDEVRKCHKYHYLYETKYDASKHKIFFQRTDIQICADLVKEGYFAFSSDDDIYYLRVLDNQTNDNEGGNGS